MTEQDTQELILAECGADANDAARKLLPLWWEKVSGDPLQAKRELLRYLQGQARNRVNVSFGNQRIEAKAEFDNTTAMLKDVESQITRGRSGGTLSVVNPGNIFG